MRKVYAPFGSAVMVFDEAELDAESFLAMMAVDASPESAPLYVKVVLSILRQLGEDNYSFLDAT